MNQNASPQTHSQWSSRSIGSRFQHHFFYVMIRFGGRHLAYLLLYLVAFYYVLLGPGIRGKTDPYLDRAFPDATRFGRYKNRYRMILNLGKTLIDRAIIGILGTDMIDASFESEGDLQRIKELDSGFILVMSHVGCWQVAMSALTLSEIPVNLLMQRHEEDVDKNYYEHRKDAQTPFRIIDPSGFLGGAIEMLNVLKKDEILCVMGDRVFGDASTAVDVRFLNGASMFPFSAYKVSSLSQKPIVIMYSYKTGPTSYQVRIADIFQVPPKIGKNSDDMRPFVRRYIATLESFVSDHPYQFFNFYDMWDMDPNTAISPENNHE